MPQMTTPLRSGDHEVRDGVRLLSADPDIPYRDGAEERLYEIVRDAVDVSSESTEMLEVAQGWAEEYHTHPARANILRALDISADAKVLEVGAGTGPITRFLGEVAGTVDSVEPVFLRAKVGRERTRDLANVEVFAGNLEEVPNEPAYDIVVVVGVLEYVGGGGADPEPYLAFLRECRSRLRPGGSLVLAIENKIGLKYVLGAAEDHSGRMFDSIEDYPRGTPARTFAPASLMDLVEQVGFTGSVYGVFPDYKHTRVVLDVERIRAQAPTLLEDLPSFPSKYAGTRSIKLASEQRVWRELGREGVGQHFANSLLVIAETEGEDPPELWPDDRLARYFSRERRRGYAAATTVSGGSDGVRFDRVYSDEPGPLIAQGVTSWRFVEGTSFPEAFVAADDAGRRTMLRRWRDLVETTVDGDTVSVDAIPTNVVVEPDGSLQLIDLEFYASGTADEVVERGLFWFAFSLLKDTPPEIWKPAATVGELYRQLAGLLDLDVDDASVDALLDREARFQAEVTVSPGRHDDVLGAKREAMERYRDTRVWDMTLGRRLHNYFDLQVADIARLESQRDKLIERNSRLVERNELLRERTKKLRARLDSQTRTAERKVESVERQKATAEQELSRITATRSYRVAASARRRVRRLLRRK